MTNSVCLAFEAINSLEPRKTRNMASQISSECKMNDSRCLTDEELRQHISMALSGLSSHCLVRA